MMLAVDLKITHFDSGFVPSYKSKLVHVSVLLQTDKTLSFYLFIEHLCPLLDSEVVLTTSQITQY